MEAAFAITAGRDVTRTSTLSLFAQTDSHLHLGALFAVPITNFQKQVHFLRNHQTRRFYRKIRRTGLIFLMEKLKFIQKSKKYQKKIENRDISSGVFVAGLL